MLNYFECLAISFHFHGDILHSIDLVSECICGAPCVAYTGKILTTYCVPDYTRHVLHIGLDPYAVHDRSMMFLFLPGGSCAQDSWAVCPETNSW